MAPLKIPVGISDFKKLREDGYYYIDKSGLIADLLTNNSEVTLITRPRRFGKTLAMSMLANFFDIQKKPDAKPIGYWKNTSDNAIFRSFIDYAGSSITMKLEAVLSGGYILQHVEENLTYDYLHSSEDNLWSILYLTG